MGETLPRESRRRGSTLGGSRLACVSAKNRASGGTYIDEGCRCARVLVVREYGAAAARRSGNSAIHAYGYSRPALKVPGAVSVAVFLLAPLLFFVAMFRRVFRKAPEAQAHFEISETLAGCTVTSFGPNIAFQYRVLCGLADALRDQGILSADDCSTAKTPLLAE